MMIRFIAALDSKRGIANDDGIPWQGMLPTDVRYFRQKTEHGVVMMGAGWYKEQLKPLPNRRNVVASSSTETLRPSFEKAMDARQYLANTKEDIWVGGGAGLFETTLDLANELYLTRIDKNFHCTKFFPEFEPQFERIESTAPLSENGISFWFEVWRRKTTEQA